MVSVMSKEYPLNIKIDDIQDMEHITVIDISHSSKIVIQLKEYKDRTFIDVRKYEEQDSELRWSKKGIMLPFIEARNVAHHIFTLCDDYEDYKDRVENE